MSDHTTTDPIVPAHIRAAIHAGHVGQVTIYCDRCLIEYVADYTGETSEIRFAAARRHLAGQGWDITDDHDHCPECKAAMDAAYDADGTAPASSFATYLTAYERDQLDARAAAAEQERDDALADLQAARAELDQLRAELARVTAQRGQIAADALRWAANRIDPGPRATRNTPLDEQHDIVMCANHGTAGLLRLWADQIQRGYIRPLPPAAGPGASRRAQGEDPATPPPGWAYVAAVWQLQQRIRDLIAADLPDPDGLIAAVADAAGRVEAVQPPATGGVIQAAGRYIVGAGQEATDGR